MQIVWGLLAATALLLPSCKAESVPARGPTQVFSSSAGQIEIDLARGSASVLGRSTKITDCSDDTYFCFEGGAGGPSLFLPRSCKDLKAVIVRRNYRLEWLHIFHPGWYLVRDSRSPDFAFVVSAGFGVGEIIYDYEKSGEVRAIKGGEILVSDKLKKYRFLKTSGDDMFKCS